MQEPHGMGSLLDWICREENIMPLGANKAAIMAAAGTAVAGDVVLLSSQTASNSTSLDFTDLFTSTYGEYIFKFYNIGPATDSTALTFQVNATDDDGGAYDESAMTSSYFGAHHTEADATGLGVNDSGDQSNDAGFQQLTEAQGNGSDESGAGELHIFNPSSTTYVKHFYSRFNIYAATDYTQDIYVAGFINITTALLDIRFKMSSGNFDGIIKMWGVK